MDDNTIGSHFPFKNREVSCRGFFNNLERDYRVWLASRGDKSDSNEPSKKVHFQVAVGAGGIGKTTFATRVFLQEWFYPLHPNQTVIRQLLESMLNSPCGHLIFQTSFASLPLLADEFNDIAGSLAVRILYSFLKNTSGVYLTIYLSNLSIYLIYFISRPWLLCLFLLQFWIRTQLGPNLWGLSSRTS